MAAELLTNQDSYEMSREETREETRRTFYKNPIKRDNMKLEYEYDTPQEQRRNALLAYQKKFRDETVNAARGILQEVFLTGLEGEEPMDIEKCTSRKSRKSRFCKYRVMKSEWLIDIPQDFAEKWIMVPCPEGKRTLLVANKGITKAYRKGKLVSIFPSALPGGNCNACRQQYAVMDCIWMGKKKVYYVMDVLAWGNQSTINCEAEFRLFWMNTKISEIGELQECTETNAYPVLPLPTVTCDSDLTSVITSFDNLYPLDGFLFYHRNGQYSFGYTPLVTWLKPFMLSEVFGIFIPSPHDGKPDNYIDYKHYILQITKNKRKRIFFQALWNL